MKIYMLFLLVLLSQPILFAQNGKTLSSANITFVFASHDTDGSISGFSSSSIVDLEHTENSTFEGSVQTETIKTGNFLRDWAIKGGKYFDVDDYPTITFKSSSVSESSEGYTVNGDLTIKKITKKITIIFVRDGSEITGTTTVYSSDFGINIKKERSDNRVDVKMEFTLK